MPSASLRVVPPGLDRDNEWFWEGVCRGQLLIQRCATCHRLRHPARPMCPACQSLDWDTQEASGRGTVHTWIVSTHPSDPTSESRIVAVVALEEGVRIVTNIVNAAVADVVNDLPVALTFVDFDGVVLPQFRLATP